LSDGTLLPVGAKRKSNLSRAPPKKTRGIAAVVIEMVNLNYIFPIPSLNYPPYSKR